MPSQAQKIILLLVTTAVVAQAQCDLPFWSSWKQADLSEDPQPKQLAIESLKDYLSGLEQASSDFKCSSGDWNGDGLEIKSACFEPSATGGTYRYAVSFSYAVQCRITDIIIDINGQDNSENTPVTLYGNVDGVIQAKQVPVGILNAAAPESVPAQEPAIEATDGPSGAAASTRNLLKKI